MTLQEDHRLQKVMKELGGTGGAGFFMECRCEKARRWAHGKELQAEVTPVRRQMRGLQPSLVVAGWAMSPSCGRRQPNPSNP